MLTPSGIARTRPKLSDRVTNVPELGPGVMTSGPGIRILVTRWWRGAKEVVMRRAVVIYESLYGNTRTIAEAIGRGLGFADEVSVVPVAKATAQSLANADLVVVGGPTHAHGMSRASTRKAAADDATKHPDRLTLEPDAEGLGVRDWLSTVGTSIPTKAAAFDTRLAGPATFMGQASRGVAKALRRGRATVVAKPESFFVSKGNVLRPGEEERAEEWGWHLAELTYADAPRRSAAV
jgi:hypothetical protein